jgi:hypothetical protein
LCKSQGNFQSSSFILNVSNMVTKRMPEAWSGYSCDGGYCASSKQWISFPQHTAVPLFPSTPRAYVWIEVPHVNSQCNNTQSKYKEHFVLEINLGNV